MSQPVKHAAEIGAYVLGGIATLNQLAQLAAPIVTVIAGVATVILAAIRIADRWRFGPRIKED